MTRRDDLIKKLLDKTQFLTKEESEELGPVSSRELAPISGDSFVDSILEKEGA